MRIKNYDYETLKDLKNPINNYDFFEYFVDNYCNKYTKDKDYYQCWYAPGNRFIILFDKNNYCYEVYKKDIYGELMDGDIVFISHKYRQCYIREKEGFEELKKTVLQCIFSRDLHKNLVEKEESKPRRLKI